MMRYFVDIQHVWMFGINTESFSDEVVDKTIDIYSEFPSERWDTLLENIEPVLSERKTMRRIELSDLGVKNYDRRFTVVGNDFFKGDLSDDEWFRKYHEATNEGEDFAPLVYPADPLMSRYGIKYILTKIKGDVEIRWGAMKPMLISKYEGDKTMFQLVIAPRMMV